MNANFVLCFYKGIHEIVYARKQMIPQYISHIYAELSSAKSDT